MCVWGVRDEDPGNEPRSDLEPQGRLGREPRQQADRRRGAGAGTKSLSLGFLHL